MIVQLTTAGAALIAANQGPIEVSSYKLGSAFGYVPSPSDTDIHGTLVQSGAPSPFGVVNPNVVKYSVYLDYNIGPFQFGELGLYTSTGVLFALAANDQLLTKIPVSQNLGNSIRLDIYLSVIGSNYDMWLDYAESNSEFRMATLNSPDQLPVPQNAVPNAYIITGADGHQSAFMAYTDRQGLWNFDCYQYANQLTFTVQSFTSQSVTVAKPSDTSSLMMTYLGKYIAEFNSGATYGTCRYVSAIVIGADNVTFSFDNPLAITPQVGDTFILFGREQFSTTIREIPIATHTTLGGVIVGSTLTVDATGLINVAPGSYPVTSVNGMTGDVILNASNVTGFAQVAYTGKYSDLIGAPGTYLLPIATTTTLGGVKAPAGGFITVAADGTLGTAAPPVLKVNDVSPDASGNVTINISGSVVGLINPTQIANGTDFNTLQTSGLFFSLDADASSFVNAPTTLAGGVLDVEPMTTTATGGDVIQRYTTTSSLYFRRLDHDSNTWSPWVSVATSSALPIATTTTLGAISVGAGLNVTAAGVLSTQIQSVNGHIEQFIVLSANDVQAVPIGSVDQPGGVPQLDATATTPNPDTDPYTYGRMRFWENTLGTWWTAGKWDASANHVIQSHTSNGSPDTNTALLDNGQQTIDISYGGSGRAGITNPSYQTVSAEGAVYEVITAGTTSLDGWAQWDVGDLAVCVNGKWKKVTVNFTNVVFSAGTF